MRQPISITSIASISPLGISMEAAWDAYMTDKHFISEENFDNNKALVSQISDNTKQEIINLRISDNKYTALDNSVLYAMYAARLAVKVADWKGDDNFGINIGSSRGATQLFEAYHQDFLENNTAKTLSSPTTTLGNISSWVAHDLQTNGPEISHSITCSTALHALLNGIAWINSGMSDKFLVGGSEAPLTAFTLAQMQALKIYSIQNQEFPCRALDLKKTHNTMILGEAASVACLEAGKKQNALAVVTGIGFATEILEHNASLSTNADCFQRSMTMAMGNFHHSTIDVIVTHTPGTIKGDQAEHNAIIKVFGSKLPALTNNKWKLGHTLGASGMLSIEMAVLMLQKQKFIHIPYLNNQSPKNINNILVNAVGFGGNAVSILLSK